MASNRAQDIIPLLGLHDIEGKLYDNIDTVGDDLIITSSSTGSKSVDIQSEGDTKAQKGPNLWLTRTNSNPQKGGYGGAIWWQTNNDAGEMVDYANLNLVISDAKNGTEDGKLAINLRSNGTRETILKFDGNGIELAIDKSMVWQNASYKKTFLKAQATAKRTIKLPDSSGDVLVNDSGAVFLTDLPTSDPSVANQLWNDSGTLKVSAG
jgi:hypothetical protein